MPQERAPSEASLELQNKSLELQNKMIACLRIWLVPAVLATASVAGLICGLVGDGLWDVAAWSALALPAAVAVRCLAAR